MLPLANLRWNWWTFVRRKVPECFDQSISDFVSSEILERQNEGEFLNKIGKLNQNSNYYEARKNSLEILKKEKLDAVFSIKKSKQKKNLKNTIEGIDEKQKDDEKCPKTKSMIECDPTLSSA